MKIGEILKPVWSGIKNLFLSLLIIGSIYLIINCILAIPLMDENNNKSKDVVNSLREELKAIRLTFNTHLTDFTYDSLTLARYDETMKAIKSNSSSISLKVYLNQRIASYKRTIENAGDLFIYKFNIENRDVNFKSINNKKNVIIQQFKKNCDSAENEITILCLLSCPISIKYMPFQKLTPAKIL